MPRPTRATLLTLATGLAGGGIATLLGLPAAWLSGSMIAVTAAAMSGMPVDFPDRLRKVTFVLLGLSLGAGFTPEALAAAARWPLSLSALFLCLPLIIGAGLVYLVRFSGWDRATAFFSVVPGALSFVMAMATESRADPRLVALTQSLRIFILVAFLPMFIVAGSKVPLPGTQAGTAPLLEGPVAMAVLIGGGIVAALVARRGMALMFAPMAVSGALHVGGIVGGGLPPLLMIPGFVLLGCLIGRRFEGTDLALLRQALGPSLGVFGVTLAVAGGFAAGVAWALALPPGQVFLAFAPGGLEAMMLLAFVLGLDPAYVGVHHVARFLGISLALPLFAKPFLDKPPEA